MCERAVRSVLLGTMLALAPLRAAAQSVPSAADLERELARLTPLYLEAERAADAVEAERAAAVEDGIDQVEVRVGPLRIVTTPAEAELARRLFQEEWPRYEAIVRGRTGRFDRIAFVFHRGADVRFRTGGSARDVKGSRFETEEGMRRRVRDAIGSSVSELLPRINAYDRLTSWPLGVSPSPAQVYRALAGAPTALGRACFEGDVDACWRGIGQMDPSTPLVDAWLTPEERRGFAWMHADLDNPYRENLRSRCLSGGEESCDLMALHYLGEAYPVPKIAHASLIWFALERGGEGALDRLWRSWDPRGRSEEVLQQEAMERLRAYREANVFDDADATALVHLGEWTNARAHLAAASGMDPDQLMRAWLTEVAAARPAAPEPTQRDRSVTIVWIAVLAALAATSTRWRLA